MSLLCIMIQTKLILNRMSDFNTLHTSIVWSRSKHFSLCGFKIFFICFRYHRFQNPISWESLNIFHMTHFLKVAVTLREFRVLTMQNSYVISNVCPKKVVLSTKQEMLTRVQYPIYQYHGKLRRR